MQIEITSNVSEVLQRFLELPGIFQRARKSALKSLGFQMIKTSVENYIRSAGEGSWEGLHPLSQKAEKSDGRWVRRRRSGNRPLSRFVHLVRYRVDSEGYRLAVDAGGGHGGEGSRPDKKLLGLINLLQTGADISVSASMRRKIAAAKSVISGKRGASFFLLRKTTSRLRIPRRPVFDPVFAKISPDIPKKFEDIFWKNIQRYTNL